MTGRLRPLSGREPPGSHTCTLLGPGGTSAAAEPRDTTAAEHGSTATAGDELTGTELTGTELAGAADKGAVEAELDAAALADDPRTASATVDARGATQPPASPTTHIAAAVTQRRTSIPKGR